MTMRIFDRLSGPILWLAALTFPLAGYASYQVLERNHNRVEDWVPRNLPETEEYVWFLEHFQGDELLVASWPGCSIDDERLDRLTEAAANARDRQGRRLFRHVHSGRSVLRQLTSEPINLPRSEAVARMRNWLIGDDGTSTCAVFMVDSLREPDRHAAVAAVVDVATRQCGIASAELKIGGPTADSVFIDDASTESLYVLSFFSIVLGVAVSWMFLRSVLFVLAVFATSMLCECWSLTLVYLADTNVDAVLIMMPALVYILAICGCIHLLNCYRDASAHLDGAEAPIRAIAFAWRPTVMAAVTTSIGLASLCVSDLVPVRRFGLFAAAGVMLSLVFLFVFLPAFLTKFGRRTPRVGAADRIHQRGGWETTVASLSIDRRRTVIGVCFGAAILLVYGASQIHTSAKIRDLFADDSRVLESYRWLERRIGPIIPIDVVLCFDAAAPMSMLEKLEFVDAVRETVAAVRHVGGVTSAATFVPPIAEAGSMRGLTQRTVMNRMIERHRSALVSNAYLAETSGEELWLISARAEAFAGVDYDRLLQDLEQHVDEVVNERLKGRGETVRVVVCGGIPLINLVQERLLQNLAASFGTTVATIGLLLAIALRNVRAAALLLIPNVFPTTLVFGVMGWAGVTVDLGSMMTISTALGISVDNELHFIAWYRRTLDRGLTRRDALLETFRHCGGPMVQSAFICALGTSVFTISGFLPTARFGALMSLLICAAAACDLILLPALLTSRLGKFFEPPPPPIKPPHYLSAKTGAAAARS